MYDVNSFFYFCLFSLIKKTPAFGRWGLKMKIMKIGCSISGILFFGI
jgi:hypothetical protein